MSKEVKVTREMREAGRITCIDRTGGTQLCADTIEAIYHAMRDARIRKERKVVDREAVAHELRGAWFANMNMPNEAATPLAELGAEDRDGWLVVADAAIAAMGAATLPEVPTPEMVRAGLWAYRNCGGWFEDSMEDAYRAMLAAWREGAK